MREAFYKKLEQYWKLQRRQQIASYFTVQVKKKKL